MPNEQPVPQEVQDEFTASLDRDMEAWTKDLRKHLVDYDKAHDVHDD